MFTEAIERVVIKRYIRGANPQELFSYLNGLKLTWKAHSFLIDEIIENLKTSLDMGFVLWYPLGTLKDKRK